MIYKSKNKRKIAKYKDSRYQLRADQFVDRVTMARIDDEALDATSDDAHDLVYTKSLDAFFIDWPSTTNAMSLAITSTFRFRI